jgi:CDP-diacylglycerol--serine O-phosphatidyltransferase
MTNATGRRMPLAAHVTTAIRALLGIAALVLALDGDDLFLSATLITVAAVLDALDGRLARWLNASTAFGARFDEVTDYLTLIVAPWVLTRAMLVSRRTMLQEVLLDSPIILGAIRYARTSAMAAEDGGNPRELPGLDAAFFAFVGVTAVFLHLPTIVAPARLTLFVTPVVAVLALLMIVPISYPRLAAVPRLSIGVLVLLAVMPFAATEILAGAAIMVGLAYIVLAPLFSTQKPSHFFSD